MGIEETRSIETNKEAREIRLLIYSLIDASHVRGRDCALRRQLIPATAAVRLRFLQLPSGSTTRSY